MGACPPMLRAPAVIVRRPAPGSAPASGPPTALRDYRIDGPEEARQIAMEKRPCETAPNGTGSRCLCDFDCANYWLRAKGFKGA